MFWSRETQRGVRVLAWFWKRRREWNGICDTREVLRHTRQNKSRGAYIWVSRYIGKHICFFRTKEKQGQDKEESQDNGENHVAFH